MEEVKKLTQLQLQIQHYVPKDINYAFENSVSYSQYSTYKSCPYKWYLAYCKGLRVYEATIMTVFGTSFHETLQNYIKVMFEEGEEKADEIDLHKYFKTIFTEVYQKEFDKVKKHFTTAEEMSEFFDDGLEILDYFKNNVSKYFRTKGYRLLGIELPLSVKLSNNLYLNGFIDLILYDEKNDKVIIFDIKTSRGSWSNKQKSDQTKQHQLLIYKKYFSETFNYPIDKIDVKFFIVKRKLWDISEFEQSRIQLFEPANGKIKMNKMKDSFNDFLINCFDSSGKPKDQSYIKIVSKNSCKYCPFSNNKSLCDKKN
jgi:hypothetical protein